MQVLDEAERELQKTNNEVMRIRLHAQEAEQRLLDAQKRVAEAEEELRMEEAAREANERTLMLLPGLRELMAPTQVLLGRRDLTIPCLRSPPPTVPCPSLTSSHRPCRWRPRRTS